MDDGFNTLIIQMFHDYPTFWPDILEGGRFADVMDHSADPQLSRGATAPPVEHYGALAWWRHGQGVVVATRYTADLELKPKWSGGFLLETA